MTLTRKEARNPNDPARFVKSLSVTSNGEIAQKKLISIDEERIMEETHIHMYTFIVTNMDSEPEKVIRFYCKRGIVENYIKESKNGFDFAAVSSSSKIVNANRLQIHALAYNIFNWFKGLALSASMRKQQIDTIRLKLLKIAAKVVHSARYITFKLCSSCPYKKEFYETLENIRGLQPKLE